MKFVRHGAAEEPSILVELYYQHALDDACINALVGEIRYRYNLDCDLSAFYAAFADDPVLGPITRRWRGKNLKTILDHPHLLDSVIFADDPVLGPITRRWRGKNLKTILDHPHLLDSVIVESLEKGYEKETEFVLLEHIVAVEK